MPAPSPHPPAASAPRPSHDTRPPSASCRTASSRKPPLPSSSCSPPAPPNSPSASACTSTPCTQQSAKSESKFLSCEERFDFAISLLNDGNYEDARTHLKHILAENACADYAFYGLAVLASMTGDAQHCLENLTEAIRLNPRNRIQARADSDFQDMADDPRFTELLYPEV